MTVHAFTLGVGRVQEQAGLSRKRGRIVSIWRETRAGIRNQIFCTVHFERTPTTKRPNLYAKFRNKVKCSPHTGSALKRCTRIKVLKKYKKRLRELIYISIGEVSVYKQSVAWRWWRTSLCVEKIFTAPRDLLLLVGGKVLAPAGLLYILRKRLAKMLKIFRIINAKEVQALGGWGERLEENNSAPTQ